MNIKLPHMPFKFDSPEGRMEITVRRGSPDATDDRLIQPYRAAVTFLEAGPRALEHIPLSARGNTYTSVMSALTGGFQVSPGAHDKESAEYRVLTALCQAPGVVDLNP